MDTIGSFVSAAPGLVSALPTVVIIAFAGIVAVTILRAALGIGRVSNVLPILLAFGGLLVAMWGFQELAPQVTDVLSLLRNALGGS